MKEEKDEESGPGKEVPSSGFKHFTLRSFPTVADSPSTQPLPHGPCLPPLSNCLSISTNPLHPTMDSLSSTVWPDACRHLGDVWKPPNVGNCRLCLSVMTHVLCQSASLYCTCLALLCCIFPLLNNSTQSI